MRARCFKETVETVAFAEKGDAYLRLRGEIIGVQLRIGQSTTMIQTCLVQERRLITRTLRLELLQVRRYQAAIAGRKLR